MALGNITYLSILGLPLIAWGGIVTFLLLVATITTAVLPKRGIRVPIKWHIGLATATLIFAAIHGFLGIASYV